MSSKKQQHKDVLQLERNSDGDQVGPAYAWKDLALNPTRLGWFKGSTYQAKTRQGKLADLWGQIMATGTNQTPAPFLWADFDELFTNNP